MKDDDDDIQDYVRPWVGLTDEEIMECLDQGYGINMRLDGFARIIEAKLKEKNNG